MARTKETTDRNRRPPVAVPELASSSLTDDERANVLFGRAEKLKVFISSEMRTGSLRAERSEAASVVDDHPDAEPWLWERNARAGRYSSFDVCIGNARTSDILILILADDLTEVTEAEWHAAKSAGANCAILLKETTSRSAKAHAFVTAQRTDCIDAPFKDLQGLRRAVNKALGQCITDAVRQRSLSRRWRSAGRLPAPQQLLQAGIQRAGQLYEQGLVRDASATVAEIELLLGHQTERPEDFELITGLIEGAEGHIAKAVAAYLRIIKNRTSDKFLVATAYQNLGIEAMRAGHLKLAERYMKAAAKRHASNENWFGVLQVLINLGSLALEAQQLDRASTLADLADELRGAFGEPLPQQRLSVIGLRGNILAQLGRYREALDLYKSTYAIARRCGDSEGETVASQNVAAAYCDLGRPDLAAAWATKALHLCGDHGSVWRREEIHRLSAVVALQTERYDDALHHYEHARSLATEMNDQWRVATLTADIGAVMLMTGADTASSELEQAARMLTDLGDDQWLVRVTSNLAILRSQQSRVDEAVGLITELATRSGLSNDLRSQLYEHLAEIHLENGNASEATRQFRKSLSFQPRNASSARTAAVYAHRLENRSEGRFALSLYNVARRRALATDDEAVTYDIRSDRAILLGSQGVLDEALAELDDCLMIAKRLRDTDRIIRAHHNIGELARRSGDTSRALTALRRACALAEKAGKAEDQRSALGLLAIANMSAGRIAAARSAADDLFEMCRANRDDNNQSVALGVLGSVAFANGDYTGAAQYFRRAATLNTSSPIQHLEDLCGVLEAHAAGGRWRPTTRAAQQIVSFAQELGLQDPAWRSLCRAARWYLDRGEWRRASILTAPAWALASQSKTDLRLHRSAEQDELFSSQFLEALLTTAFHELWSGKPCDGLYRQALHHLDLDNDYGAFESLIQEARKTAVLLDSASAV